MMNEKIVEGIKGYYDDQTATVYLEVSGLAKKFGITRNSNGTEYPRWNRINDMMKDILTTSGQKFNVSIPLRKGDYIPEDLAYIWVMRLNNDSARDFQETLVRIIKSFRENGIETGNEFMDSLKEFNDKEYANGKRQILTNGINMYGSAAGINRGEANKRFQKCFDDMNGTRIKQRAKNYGKKKGVKNMSVNQYIDEHDMYDKAGDALYHLVYGLYEFAKMDVAPNNNQQMNDDDGYYHPENDWHIIASVVWTDQGTRITCETWENGLGTREQRVRKEQI